MFATLMKMTGRVSEIIRSDRGLSLAGLVVAVGVGTILTLMVATILNQIFRNSARTMAVSDAAQAAQLIQLVLSNPTYCDSALTDSAGAKINFPPLAPSTSVPVGRIYMRDQSGTINSLVMQAGTKLNPKVTLDTMTLSEQVPGQGPSKTQFYIAGTRTDYNLYNVYLTLNFKTSDNIVGGTIPPVKIPMTVASNGTVDYCYHNEDKKALCAQVGGTIDASGNCVSTIFSRVAGRSCLTTDPSLLYIAPTKPQCPTPIAGCTMVYYVSQFDTDGSPLCGCTQACATP